MPLKELRDKSLQSETCQNIYIEQLKESSVELGNCSYELIVIKRSTMSRRKEIEATPTVVRVQQCCNYQGQGLSVGFRSVCWNI